MVFLIRKPKDESSFFEDVPKPSHPGYHSSNLPNLAPRPPSMELPPTPPIFERRGVGIEESVLRGPIMQSGARPQPNPALAIPRPVIREKIIPRQPDNIMGPAVSEKRMIPKQPLFVKVGDYQDVVESTRTIKTTIDEAEKIIARLNEIRTEQEKEFAKWRVALEEVERKLAYVDKVIFET